MDLTYAIKEMTAKLTAKLNYTRDSIQSGCLTLMGNDFQLVTKNIKLENKDIPRMSALFIKALYDLEPVFTI